MQMRTGENLHRHQLQSTVKIAKVFHSLFSRPFDPRLSQRVFTKCLQFNELLMVVVQKSSRLFLMLDFVLLLVVSFTA